MKRPFRSCSVKSLCFTALVSFFSGAAFLACGDSSSSAAKGGACVQDQDCRSLGDGAYCQWSPERICGHLGGMGSCTTRPSACDSESEPVCGCDGMTYENACQAARAGVSVAKREACALGAPGQAGRPCAGLSEGRCDAGLFCSYLPETKCGTVSKQGVCLSTSQACSGPSEPVCGCDGRTYDSACLAANAGISVSRRGDCKIPPGGPQSPCGLAPFVSCASGLYCKYSAQNMCGRAGELGECTPLSTQCSDDYSPVCDCDGKTHLNDCRAAREGVNVAHLGRCVAPQDSDIACDGSGDFNCAVGYFCNYPPETNCGSGQAWGVCAKLLKYCGIHEDEEAEDKDDEYQGQNQEDSIVCGCDNRTYGSACLAAVSGVSIAHTGACPAASPVGQLGDVCAEKPPITCANGLFCSYTHRPTCKFEITIGRCEEIPKDCSNDYDPVCGCGLRDYRNECLARQAMASILYWEPCYGQ